MQTLSRSPLLLLLLDRRRLRLRRRGWQRVPETAPGHLRRGLRHGDGRLTAPDAAAAAHRRLDSAAVLRCRLFLALRRLRPSHLLSLDLRQRRTGCTASAAPHPAHDGVTGRGPDPCLLLALARRRALFLFGLNLSERFGLFDSVNAPRGFRRGAAPRRLRGRARGYHVRTGVVVRTLVGSGRGCDRPAGGSRSRVPVRLRRVEGAGRGSHGKALARTHGSLEVREGPRAGRAGSSRG